MKPFVLVKQFATLAAIALVITLAACGGGSSTANPNSVTGNWNVTLFDSSNTAAYAFTTTLDQQNPTPSISTPVTGRNLGLKTTTDTCFTADANAKQTGVFTVNDTFNGLTVNTLQLTVEGTTSTPGTTSNISMRGTFTTDNISGPWSLTLSTPNSQCKVSGVFLMTRM